MIYFLIASAPCAAQYPAMTAYSPANLSGCSSVGQVEFWPVQGKFSSQMYPLVIP